MGNFSFNKFMKNAWQKWKSKQKPASGFRFEVAGFELKRTI